MKALVIGADGFVGRHLVAHLREAGDEVFEGTGPSADATREQQPVDVTHPDSVDDLIRTARPDAVYHLAAVAYGPDAADDISRAIDVTVTGTANVVRSIAEHAPSAHVLVTGSSEVYGDPGLDTIPESAPLQPVNLYGATKVAQESIALAFARSRDVAIIATRSFNHIGPGQRDSFAVASFARQLRKVEMGEAPPHLKVGNLRSVRDFSDVRDVVRAYRALVVGGHRRRAVNVGNGRGVAVGDILEHLIAISGLDVEVIVDPSRVRKTDPPRIVADTSLIRTLTGWSPNVPLDQTLTDVWRDAQQRWR